MADSKISDLTAATAAAATNELPINEAKAKRAAYSRTYRAAHPEYREKQAVGLRVWRAAHPGYMREWRQRNLPLRREQERLAGRKYRTRVDALKAKPCIDCGGTFPPECMQFDHVRGVKVKDVSRMASQSLAVIMAEIAKCDLVCANCHAIRTIARSRRG